MTSIAARFRLAVRLARLRKLGEGAAIFDRHDLLELRQIGREVLQDGLRLARVRVVRVTRDQRVQAFGILFAHVDHDAPDGNRDVAALLRQLLQRARIGGQRFELHHVLVQPAFEIALLVEHVGDAARHAGREIAPRRAEHDDDAAGHIFAAVIAGAFDDRIGAGVPDGEALARDAAEIAFARDGAIEHRIADDDAFFRRDAGFRIGPHDQLAARKTLADIVVAFADQIERHAMRGPGAERLSCRALQRQPDRVFRQAGMAIAPGDLAREHRAGRAVDVLDARTRP